MLRCCCEFRRNNCSVCCGTTECPGRYWVASQTSLERFVDLTGELPVQGFLHVPDHGNGDCLVLTHGAGSNCESKLLVAVGNAFAAAGFKVLRCDLPFRQMRPH